MANVNRTPLNTIPQSWAFDEEVGPWIRELLEVLRQLRDRTGGDDDIVDVNFTEVYTAYAQARAALDELVRVSRVNKSNTVLTWLSM